MTNTTIKFIDNPPFSVNFTQFVPKKENEPSTKEKIVSVATKTFQFIKEFFVSLCQATYVTLANAGVSFRYIVLGYYGRDWTTIRPPESLPLAVFKVAIWVISMGWCVVTTTKQLVERKIGLDDHTSYLRRFCGDEINPIHIKVEDMSINMSNVPKDVSVDDLATIFTQINLTDKTKPGYMDPKSLQEGTSETLAKFIDHVKNRTAFIGTPPSYDTPGLMRFYQQIEDAVRFSINQSNVKLAEFKEKYKEDPNLPYYEDSMKALPTEWDEDEKKNYEQDRVKYHNELSNLLEDRARIAIDMAIAGDHCGARYMGEAMEIYYLALGESINPNKNFEETLQDLLAHKRLEIAKGQIQEYFGKGRTKSVDTHSYNKYMANLGKILGLPGAENMVEHLDNNIDINKYVELFFQKYTVDVIIQTIQEKAKTSQEFREKLTDWLKGEPDTWKKNEYDMLAQNTVVKINEVLGSLKDSDEPSDMKHVNRLIKLAAHLQEKNVTTEEKSLAKLLRDDWDKGLADLFALPEAKQWSKENISENALTRTNEVQGLKNACSKEALGELLPLLQKAVIDGGKINLAPFKEKFSNLEKVEKIQEAIAPTEDEDGNDVPGVNINTDVLLRALENNNLEEIVRNQLDLERQSEFLDQLKLAELAEKKIQVNGKEETVPVEKKIVVKGKEITVQVTRVQQEGLSKELLEWALVSQNVLFPQIQEASIETVEATSVQARKAYISAINNSFKVTGSGGSETELKIKTMMTSLTENNPNIEEIERLAEESIKNSPIFAGKERYQFSTLSMTNREIVFQTLFNCSFVNNADALIDAAENLKPGAVSYPLWKRVCLIQIPTILSVAFDNPVTYLALFISTFVFGTAFVEAAYQSTSHFVMARALPFFINNAPLGVIQGINAAWGARDRVFKVLQPIYDNWLPICLGLLIAQIAVRNLPDDSVIKRIVRVAVRILNFIFIRPDEAINFIPRIVWDTAFFLPNRCAEIGSYFREVVRGNENDRMISCRKKVYDIGVAAFLGLGVLHK